MSQWRPIVSALVRSRTGAVLIALQMAVTLAILSNALFVVQQRLSWSERPTGIDESYVFAIGNEWIGPGTDLSARLQTDLQALRSIGGVVDAYASNVQPLSDNDFNVGITLDPAGNRGVQLAAVYFGDQQALRTLGVRLWAGRDLRAAEVSDCSEATNRPPGAILVTRALAARLAGAGGADSILGRTATLMPGRMAAPIVGIIARLQAPAVDEYRGSDVVENSIVWPCRDVSRSAFYIVRTRPGALDAAMKGAPGVLTAISRARVIESVQSLRAARRDIYRSDRTLARLLLLICAVLVVVTSAGTFGLTSYWVSQRRRQIGIRRALGATWLAIMRHFQTENLVITTGGIVIGVVLAVAGNLWIVKSFAMGRLPYEYLLVGVVALLALGQLAVLWPALRAAAVPPAVATRNI